MATNFASLIAQQGLQNTSVQNTPAVADAFAKGAQIANQREQLRQAQQTLDKDKAALNQAKLEKFVNAIQAGKDQKGSARSNYYGKILPNYRDALGLTDVFNDEALQFATATPENMARLNTIVAEVRAGRITESQGIALFNDPTQFAGIAPMVADDLYGDLAEAAKTSINARAQENALRGQYERQAIDIDSTGQQAIAREAGQEFVKFQGAGGLAGMNKAEAALEDAIKKLESREVITGGALEQVPFGGATPVIARTNKPLKALQDKVLSTQNIKALSGDPNPTQQQIDAINSRILDPTAPNETNIDKLKAELGRLREERVTKENLFRQQGFLRNGGQSSGTATPAPTPRSPAPGAPASPGASRNIQELSNPARAKTISAYVGDSWTKLVETAAAYGVGPAELKQQLEGAANGNTN